MPSPNTVSAPEPGKGNNIESSSTIFSIRQETLAVVSLLTVCCFFLYHDFLACNKLYLFKDIASDSLNVFYPKFFHNSAYIRSYGVPGWSFNIGLGQDSFPFSLGNPFELLLILFPPHLVGYAIIFAECAKCILSGLLIYKAFSLSLFSRQTSLAGCILYAFSGYMVVGGQWSVFSVEAFHVALFIYAFERYLIDNTKVWLVSVFFLVAAFTPFSIYLISFFSALYIFFRLWIRRDPLETACRTILDVALTLIAGVGLAAVFFLPALLQMVQNPRSDAMVQKLMESFAQGPFRLETSKYYLTLFMRMFSSHLEGLNTGWKNYLEAPLMYMGLPIIMLAPLSFIATDRRYRVGMGIVLTITSAILIFPSFRFAFWLGTNTYVRFAALMADCFILIAALKAIELTERWERKHLLLLAGTVFFSTTILILLPATGIIKLETAVRNTVIIFLFIYLILLTCQVLHPRKNLFKTLFIATLCIEVVTISSFSVKDRDVVSRAEHEGRFGYNDFSSEAVRHIKEQDRTFFRIYKWFGSAPTHQHASLNDGMVQGFYGVTSYQSFNHHNLIRFLKTMGVIENITNSNTRWISMNNVQPLLLTLLNCKYSLIKMSAPKNANIGYDPIAITGDVITLKNPKFLPFGYSYGHYISMNDFERLSSVEKQTAIMRACLIEDDETHQNTLKRYVPVKGAQYSIDDFNLDFSELSQNALKLTMFHPERIEGDINFDRPRLLLFAMPFDKGWKAFVDGKPGKLVLANGGLAGVLVTPGKHKVELVYKSPWRTTGLLISVSTAFTLFILFIFRRRRFNIANKEP